MNADRIVHSFCFTPASYYQGGGVRYCPMKMPSEVFICVYQRVSAAIK